LSGVNDTAHLTPRGVMAAGAQPSFSGVFPVPRRSSAADGGAALGKVQLCRTLFANAGLACAPGCLALWMRRVCLRGSLRAAAIVRLMPGVFEARYLARDGYQSLQAGYAASGPQI